MTDEQPPLFTVPAPEKPWRPPRTARAKARYAKYRPAQRTLCDDCCADIHRRGQAVAPLPARALWRRTDPDGAVMVLCQRHKDERHRIDEVMP